jgi:UDP:flavonoid glycosyltransferase YjiC (YdhE family)
VPQIIIPHILDQYYWGNQVYKAHLGAKPIWRSKISAKKLTTAIHECLSGISIIETTKKAAREIDIRESLNNAVEYIEKRF